MRRLKMGEYRTNFKVECFDVDGESFVEASTAFILSAVEIAKSVSCWRAEVICEGTGMILYTFENGKMTYSFTE